MLQTIALLWLRSEHWPKGLIPSHQSLAKIPTSRLTHKYVSIVDVVDGSSMIENPLVIADTEQDIPGTLCLKSGSVPIMLFIIQFEVEFGCDNDIITVVTLQVSSKGTRENKCKPLITVVKCIQEGNCQKVTCAYMTLTISLTIYYV